MNKNAIIITLGRVFQMLTLFVTYRVLSSVLSVKDMGIYYFLLSIAGAFGLIYANPIGMYTNRILHSWLAHSTLIKNLNYVLKSFLVGSVLTIPILLFYKDKISLSDNSLTAVVITMVFYVFSTSINGTIIPSLNLLGHTKQFVAFTLLTNLVGLFFSLIFVKIFSPKPLYWLMGQGASLTLFGVIAFFYLKKTVKDIIDLKHERDHVRLKRVFKFAFPIMVTNIALWVLAQSFRFFYKDNIDPTLLGELTFGLGLATSLCVAVEYLFQQLYLPEFYAHINEPNIDKGVVWNKLFNKLVPIYIYFTIFLVGLSPFIMRVLADVKFKNSSYYLAVGALVEFARMIGNTFAMATHSEMKTHKAMVPYLSGGLITIFGVLYICRHPEFVRFTPFCLMAGYLVASIYLGKNVKSMIRLNISIFEIVKYILTASVFLLALFLSRFSQSLMSSIGVGFVFGLLLLFFFYQSYIKRRDDW